MLAYCDAQGAAPCPRAFDCAQRSWNAEMAHQRAAAVAAVSITVCSITKSSFLDRMWAIPL